MTTTRRVTFAQRDVTRFVETVKRRVPEYFESRGLSPKANASMIAKTVIMLSLTFGTYGLILSGWFSPWQMLGLAVLMGIGMAGIGFAVAHDALHGAYSENPRVNRLVGYTFDLIGANGYMWKITHNVIHHTYTNIHGVDEDLTVSPLLRLSPESEWKPIHRFQHWYAFFAYGFSTLFWVFVKDYMYFMKKELGPYKDKKHPKSEWVTLFVTKAIYYSWSIVVPLLVLDLAWWQFLVGWLTMHLVAGGILGIVFQLAHVVEHTAHLQPDEKGMMEHAWMVHEMETTSNFARHNKLLSWYVGGLNFQVEHHLFPKICSVHYPVVSEIVKQTALECGITYNEHATFREAVASHYRMLKQLGRPPQRAAQAVAAAA